MDRPFYSIIIPTYNRPQWAEECIRSIINQSFGDFEVIVSDDSSNTDIESIVIDNFDDKRIKYIRNSPRLGRVRNYRECIMNRSRGRWVLICDGDDYLIDYNYLVNVHRVIKGNPNIVLVQAGHYKGELLENSVIKVPNIEKQEILLSGMAYIEHFDKINHFSHLSTLSRLDILKRVDPFSVDILSADIVTYLKVARHGNVYLIKKPVCLWRQHSGNITVTSSFKVNINNTKWPSKVLNYCNKEFNDSKTRYVKGLRSLSRSLVLNYVIQFKRRNKLSLGMRLWLLYFVICNRSFHKLLLRLRFYTIITK